MLTATEGNKTGERVRECGKGLTSSRVVTMCFGPFCLEYSSEARFGLRLFTRTFSHNPHCSPVHLIDEETMAQR